MDSYPYYMTNNYNIAMLSALNRMRSLDALNVIISNLTHLAQALLTKLLTVAPEFNL